VTRSHLVSYLHWIGVVEQLEALKARIERRIEAEASVNVQSRATLPGTTAQHLANGMKTKDDRIADLDKKIDRAVARATMHGMGMLFDALQK
jgi:hypothetical protein